MADPRHPPEHKAAKPPAAPPEEPKVAVALDYDGSETAPRVVASGRGAVADQILRIAFAEGVKVREDADLAEVLASVDVDQEIPLEAFAAVAEILAYVYRANGRTPEDGPPVDPEARRDAKQDRERDRWGAQASVVARSPSTDPGSDTSSVIEPEGGAGLNPGDPKGGSRT
ncbi:MAG: EscU/YscU/HrcU family type III secretion system export apparatus switch protein [Rhodospirillaceae bacterium]